MTFQDLLAHKKLFESTIRIFEVFKSVPKEKAHSLSDQIRRSSRSVPANIAAAYRKRMYSKSCDSKLSNNNAEHSDSSLVRVRLAL